MQDMEFTIENGKLYMLQTRNGKRTAAAALKIAVDLVDEGMITEDEAVMRVEPKQLDSLLHPQFDAKALKAAEVIGTGPGRFSRRCLRPGGLHRRRRQEVGREGREGRSGPSGDLSGGHRGHGGRSGHPDRSRRHDLPRGGCRPRHGHLLRFRLRRDQDARGRKILRRWAARPISEGDCISIDGSTGNIYGEAIPTVEATISGDFGRFMAWADAARKLKVRTNADTPRDAAQAVKFGAEGIGLCRTEHMFFEGDRIKAMREMIVAKNVEARKMALAKLLPYQQGDFEAMYQRAGRPSDDHPLPGSAAARVPAHQARRISQELAE